MLKAECNKTNIAYDVLQQSKGEDKTLYLARNLNKSRKKDVLIVKTYKRGHLTED